MSIFFHLNQLLCYIQYIAEMTASDSSDLQLGNLCFTKNVCPADSRQISVISADGENVRSRSVRRHACSQRKHADMQDKKPQEMEKLIQAEATETGRVSIVLNLYVNNSRFLLSIFSI